MIAVKGCDYPNELEIIFKTVTEKLGYDLLLNVRRSDGRISGCLKTKRQIQVQRGKKKNVPQYVVKQITCLTNVCVWFHYLTEIDSVKNDVTDKFHERVNYFDQAFVLEIGGDVLWEEAVKAARFTRKSMETKMNLHLGRGYPHVDSFKFEGIQHTKIHLEDFCVY